VALEILMNIEDLLSDAERRRFAAQPEADPLTEPGALQEAQLLDVRVDAVTSTVRLLFDLRTSLQFMMGNTAVLVAHGVREFRWLAEPRTTVRTAWNVVASEPSSRGRFFCLEVGFVPNAQLTLVAESAEFYLGDVVGLRDTPPDFGRDDESSIGAGLADWRSPFTPIHAVFLDAAPSLG
jgi:hypothetical protein